MSAPVIKFKRFNPDARPPYRKHNTDAGFDLSAAHEGMIVPGQVAVPVKTGVGLEIPHGYVALLRDRSSVAAKGVFLTAGVIDADYRGEILVLLTNLGKEPFTFAAGDRITQVLILPCHCFPLSEVNQLSETERGTGGFGSTGTGSPITNHQIVS